MIGQRLRARDRNTEVLTTYVKPFIEQRNRDKSQAHCVPCGRERTHEVIVYQGRSTITCTSCGHQEVDTT